MDYFNRPSYLDGFVDSAALSGIFEWAIPHCGHSIGEKVDLKWRMPCL